MLILSGKKEDREAKLKKAACVLKKEFVGLDDVIDSITSSISPWYITPEIIMRPIVVSLWGMTGTGKTSVVKRLVELLDLEAGLVVVDCGGNLSDEKSVQNRVLSSLGIEGGSEIGDISSGNSVFLFDEFQNVRTIDESMKEVDRPDFRDVWKILDDGRLDISYTYNYELDRLINFIDDLDTLPVGLFNIKLKGGEIYDKHDVELYLREMETWYDNDRKGKFKPLPVLNKDQLRLIKRRLKSITANSESIINSLSTEPKTLGELCGRLREIKCTITTSARIDCSKSLVFVIGNLDEAFSSSDEVSPDIDADIFYHMTEQVTIFDIKDALKKRFRAEQIARLGNNIIKYPTLSKDNFKKVIDLEIDRILSNFNSGINITVSSGIKALLYSEGIFPTQGVRPVFTTIWSLLVPYLSRAITEKTDIDTEVTIDIKNQEDWTKWNFSIPETTVLINYPQSGKSIEVAHKLQLGQSRCPWLRKTRYINSVHEAGHAVMKAYLTGDAPINIISVASDHGGLCVYYDKDKASEISSRHDIDVDALISLSGYLAESIIYSDRPEMRLMGSESDIDSSWESFCSSALRVGYFRPVLMSSWKTTSASPEPVGLDIEKTLVNYFDGERFTEELLTVEEAINRRMKDLTNEAQVILKNEVRLIKNLALHLGEFGSMGSDMFMKFVEENGNILTPEFMEKQKEKYSTDYYLSKLY